MSRKIQKLLGGLIVVLLLTIYQNFLPKKVPPSRRAPIPSNKVILGQQISNNTVTKVVDGDTIEVLLNGTKQKVRIIGINTPETVDPRKGVECFGKEASNKAKEILTNQTVRLENDITQSDTDKYGRLLRYVFLSNNTDFGLQMIKEGYAYEYTYDTPYKYQKEYRKAQQEAEFRKVGLWAENSCAT